MRPSRLRILLRLVAEEVIAAGLSHDLNERGGGYSCARRVPSK